MKTTAPDARKDLVKISANLPKAELELLRQLAARLGMNMTDVIRSALKLEEFVQDAKRKGDAVLIRKENGEMRELLVR